MRIARYGLMVAAIALLAVGCAAQETGQMTFEPETAAKDQRESKPSARNARMPTGPMQQYSVTGATY